MSKHLKTLIKEKPEGATMYDKGFQRYMKRDNNELLQAFINNEWKYIRLHSGGKNMVVSVLGVSK